MKTLLSTCLSRIVLITSALPFCICITVQPVKCCCFYGKTNSCNRSTSRKRAPPSGLRCTFIYKWQSTVCVAWNKNKAVTVAQGWFIHLMCKLIVLNPAYQITNTNGYDFGRCPANTKENATRILCERYNDERTDITGYIFMLQQQLDMINAGINTGEQETHMNQAFQERAEERPPTISSSSLRHVHVYELVTTTQGALRLLSASQAYSSVVWAQLIDGREQKRRVG